MKKLTLIGVLFTISALLVAGTALAEEPVEGRNGRAELRFLEGMIDHHQMALDMANDCLMHAGSDDVLALCQNVIDAQSTEIATMQGWLLDWYNVEYAPVAMMPMDMTATEAPMAGMDHGDMGPNTDPAMMMGMMAGLNRVEGPDYEVAWLESMIDHHDDALHMAGRILTRAEHDELRALAEAIIADQTAEIEHMETLLADYDN